MDQRDTADSVVGFVHKSVTVVMDHSKQKLLLSKLTRIRHSIEFRSVKLRQPAASTVYTDFAKFEYTPVHC